MTHKRLQNKIEKLEQNNNSHNFLVKKDDYVENNVLEVIEKPIKDNNIP